MNYIKKIESDISSAHNAIHSALDELHQFRVFILTSPKFIGIDLDGERKDWISTGDVAAWIDRLRSEIIDKAPACTLTELNKVS